MKKLLLLFTLAPCLTFGQTTYVPDDVLEEVLEGSLFDNDNYVLTSTVEGNISLGLDGNDGQISDFTGLEDAINLTQLIIRNMTAPTLQLVGVTVNYQLYFDNNLSSNIILDNCAFNNFWVLLNPLLTTIEFHNSNSLISGPAGGGVDSHRG